MRAFSIRSHAPYLTMYSVSVLRKSTPVFKIQVLILLHFFFPKLLKTVLEKHGNLLKGTPYDLPNHENVIVQLQSPPLRTLTPTLIFTSLCLTDSSSYSWFNLRFQVPPKIAFTANPQSFTRFVPSRKPDLVGGVIVWN